MQNRFDSRTKKQIQTYNKYNKYGSTKAEDMMLASWNYEKGWEYKLVYKLLKEWKKDMEHLSITMQDKLITKSDIIVNRIIERDLYNKEEKKKIVVEFLEIQDIRNKKFEEMLKESQHMWTEKIE
jgi:hypothetical protein